MKTLRVIDQAGNRQDYDTEFVPRIGERISLTFGTGSAAVTEHFYRVQDVMYRLDMPSNVQVAILVAEDSSDEPWPS
jgi:hypothetical protein